MASAAALARGTIALPALSLALAAAAPAAAQEEELDPIVIIGTTPMPGTGIPKESFPATVQTLEASDFEALAPRNLTDLLDQRLTGVTVKDVQNSPYQQNIDYRGFTLSPLLGEAQGLAVYLNGVRINEAFGDSLQWDLVPEAAIERIDLVAGNPVFGLNALGGALAIRTKQGLDWEGGQVEVGGGSFGRLGATLEAGGSTDETGAYAAVERSEEDGWRDLSEGEILRFFGDVGHRGDRFELGATLLKADTELTGNGPLPEDVLSARRESVYTWPDITQNDLTMGMVRGSLETESGLTLSALAYARNVDRDTVNGDEFDGCFAELPANVGLGDTLYLITGEGAEDLCELEEGEAPMAPDEEYNVLHDTDGEPITTAEPEDEDGEVTVGARNLTFTETETRGGTLQLDGDLDGHTFAIGLSYDSSETTYRGHALVGELQEDRGVPAWRSDDGEEVTIGQTCEVEDDGTGFGGTAAGMCDDAPEEYTDANPLLVSSDTRSWGLYASDTFSLMEGTDLTLSGRYNSTKLELDLHDGEGTASHSFGRFNPAVGVSHTLSPAVTLFGGYREASRAPTPAELSCADPDDACRLPNAFLADPPLDQVVARTVEFGARGRTGSRTDGLAWEASLYGTENKDDIIFIAVPGDQPGLGYFDNFGKTRRLGLDVGAAGQSGRFDWFASYSYLQATFRTGGELPGGNHPEAEEEPIPDEDEPRRFINVESGDRIPGLPDHTLKAGVGYMVLDGLRLGANTVVRSGVHLRGDESNQLPKTSSYAVFNLTAEYRIGGFTLFGRVDNVFDAEYENFGILGECEEEDPGEPCEGEVEILNHGLEGNAHHTHRFVSPGAPRGFFFGLRYSF